ncbi:MAG: hypothetical protein AAF411_27155 [Myxococcota bacterium]
MPRSAYLFLLILTLACDESSVVPDDDAGVDVMDQRLPDMRADDELGWLVDVGFDQDAPREVGLDRDRDAGPVDFLPAFPGAEGYGAITPGGRGGRTYVVTTLDWDGPGSFSEALFATEPRTIVFAVSGVIEVPTGAGNLDESNAFVTIAGETSPGGITFVGGGATLSAYRGNFHDMIVRHVRFRGRNAYDNISLNTTHNLIFDHCDFSGGTDEALDITFSHDYTIQWSTVSNSGPTGQLYGTLFAYAPTTNVSFHHNFSANHSGRCAPHMHWGNDGPGEGARVDLVNNVFYNCGRTRVFHAQNVESATDGTLFLNVVGNTARPGPDTPLTENTFFTNLGSWIHLYANDNAYENDQRFFSRAYHEPTLVDAPHGGGAVFVDSREAGRDLVVDLSGAWPRDPMGERTANDFRNGTGSVGDVSDPLIESGPQAPVDADQDGMPDEWEEEHGLELADPADAAALTESGYSNLELYLHGRAEAILGR